MVLGPVKCGVSEENTTAPPARYRSGFGGFKLLEALKTKRIDVAVGQRARAMNPGGNPRATVVDRGVVERHPDCEVLLGFDIGVAVVLMPREPSGFCGLLVNGLIPVQIDIWTDEVDAY